MLRCGRWTIKCLQRSCDQKMAVIIKFPCECVQVQMLPLEPSCDTSTENVPLTLAKEIRFSSMFRGKLRGDEDRARLEVVARGRHALLHRRHHALRGADEHNSPGAVARFACVREWARTRGRRGESRVRVGAESITSSMELSARLVVPRADSLDQEYTPARVYECTSTCVHKTDTRTHSRTHTHTHTYMRTRTLTRPRSHAHSHAHVHTHTLTLHP
eukprot:6188523-Pleurochrysis_carterae.AAC.1